MFAAAEPNAGKELFNEVFEMSRYPLLSAKNLPAYAVVMLVWAGFSVVLALVLRTVTNAALGWPAALVFCAVAVMLGMSIMFGASAVNLRKLRPGFERLADGASDPAIPRVWCPVLTMATRAAVELSEKVRSSSSMVASGAKREQGSKR